MPSLTRPPARRRLGFRLGAAETRQPARALALDQGFEGLAHERGLFADAGEGLGFGEEVVIEGECATFPNRLVQGWSRRATEDTA